MEREELVAVSGLERNVDDSGSVYVLLNLLVQRENKSRPYRVQRVFHTQTSGG